MQLFNGYTDASVQAFDAIHKMKSSEYYTYQQPFWSAERRVQEEETSDGEGNNEEDADTDSKEKTITITIQVNKK